MKRIILLTIACLMLTACTVQEAHLVYRPEETADAATAAPTETPGPDTLDLPTITGEPFHADANGVLILDEQTHYLEYYVTLNNVRIYEYGEGTFLDATAVNSFPQTLTGGIRLTFHDANGVVYGYGDLYTADGKLRLLPGENRVYADILTEVDVQMMDFTVSVEGGLSPENP